MSKIDIIVFFTYIVGITVFGAYFYKRSQTAEEFTIAKHRLPGWAVGMSIFGTYLSSISFLALPGKAYNSNWNAFVFSLSLPFAAFIATKWFVPLYRNLGEVSAYAYLEKRFGLWARMYAMICYILTQFARIGTILFLVALALQSLMGWDIAYIILATGVLVILYTVVGGIEAVIWTDVVQAIILTIGAMVVIGVIFFNTSGGADEIINVALSYDKFSLGSFNFDFTASTFWVVFLFGFVINIQNFGIDQSYVQRYQTSKTEKDAKNSVWLGALLYVPVSAMFFFIGSALFSYYNISPELLATELKANGMGDKIFPYFIVHELPSGLIGLLIASLFAAAMSSVDSSLNSSATVLMSDVYKRFINKSATDHQLLVFVRYATIIMGIIGTGVGLLMINIKSALDIWWSISGIFSGGMIGLFLLGVISTKVTSKKAGFSVVIGILVIFWATFSPRLDVWWANGFHTLMTTVIGTLTIFLIGYLFTKISTKT